MTDLRGTAVGRATAGVAGGFLVQAAVIFLAAGTWWWPVGWLYLAAYLVFAVSTAPALGRRDPVRLVDPLPPVPPRTPVSRALTVGGASMLATLFVAVPAHAVRLGGAAALPDWARVLGFVGVLGAFVLMGRTLTVHSPRATADAPPSVEDAVASGPYRLVRHPFHLAVLVWATAFPLALGSAWGLVPAGVLVVLGVLHAAEEDRVLRAELPAYGRRVQETPWVLVPGVW